MSTSLPTEAVEQRQADAHAIRSLGLRYAVGDHRTLYQLITSMTTHDLKGMAEQLAFVGEAVTGELRRRKMTEGRPSRGLLDDEMY